MKPRQYLSRKSTLAVIGTLCLASLAFGLPYPELVENDQGELFQLVPLNRVRRAEVYGNVDITDPGQVIIGAKGTPIDNANHRLDTHIFATDNIRQPSPLTVGGEARYLHKPTGSTASLAASRTEQWGTDLKASGKYNIYQDKTTNANLEAYVSKHIGGIPGNRPIDYGVMFNLRKTF